MYSKIGYLRYSNTPTDSINDEANIYPWGGYSGMSNQNTWAIACTCEAIKIGVSGAAVVSAFCHCENCRHWTGDAEVASVAVWNPECVEFLEGKDSIVVEKDLGDEQLIDRYCCPTCSDVIYIAINNHYSLTAIRHDVLDNSLVVSTSSLSGRNSKHPTSGGPLPDNKHGARRRNCF